ncbi:hypothetical protein [Rhizobium tubonense]|nr:hypothetical protein [Rhizobium tubonense]
MFRKPGYRAAAATSGQIAGVDAVEADLVDGPDGGAVPSAQGLLR